MNIKKHTYIILSALAFTACSHDDNSAPTYTVGDADNAIVLSAGIAEGPSSVSSRGAEDNHSKHVAFKQGTKLALKVIGDWWKQGDDDATPISQTTTATIGAVTGADSKHNPLSMSPQLYWDDYGTADPANAGEGRGRKKGLTIYAAAIDGVTTAPTVSSWTDLSWTLDTDQKTNDWKNKDLLISNNIKGDGNRFTFANAIAETKTNNILEFTHAMSKVTVNLTAGEGFVDSKFVSEPSVTLLKFNYTGTVSIEAKTSTPTSEIANINACINGGTTWASANKAQATAIVFPGNQFADANDIIKINCDGNIYYVNATMINAVNNETNKKFEQGKNYIFNITVKKTKIEVTATIKDWEDVEASPVEPVINVSAQVGGKGATDGTFSAFDFYMSESSNTGYTLYGNANGNADGLTKWQFKDGSSNNISLYWPTHDTHYFMRGVSPTSTTVTESKISVANAEYNSATPPSNLMIGAPEIAANTMCGNSDHTQVDMSTNGICARNNTVNLNFRYAMSQVEVRLKSDYTVGDGKVNIDDNTTIEIIGGYDKARIELGTRQHDTYTDADKATNDSYNMHTSSASVSGITKIMHDIIVPQPFSNDLKFKITITNSDSSTDTYFATIKDIKVTEQGDSEAKLITAWDPGKHYIYTFNMRKTEITVTATLTDWKTFTASEEVRF